MRIIILAGSLLAAPLFAGCGDCSEEDLDGTYVISFDERSGDCGPQTEAIFRYKEGKPVGDISDDTVCDTDYDKMTNDECTSESKGTCTDADAGIIFETTLSMTEDNKDGEEYSGVMSLLVTDLMTGDYICSSTYDVTAERR